MQKKRLRERAKKNKEIEEYDVAPYAYSKNVFHRTEVSVNNFIKKNRKNLGSVSIINNY